MYVTYTHELKWCESSPMYSKCMYVCEYDIQYNILHDVAINIMRWPSEFSETQGSGFCLKLSQTIIIIIIIIIEK